LLVTSRLDLSQAVDAWPGANIVDMVQRDRQFLALGLGTVALTVIMAIATLVRSRHRPTIVVPPPCNFGCAMTRTVLLVAIGDLLRLDRPTLLSLGP
jgi:hypothetical protein